jgi:hypothetical protein
MKIKDILSRYRIETRSEGSRHNYVSYSWLVLVDKVSNKVLCKPGTRQHLRFDNSDEIITYLTHFHNQEEVAMKWINLIDNRETNRTNYPDEVIIWNSLEDATKAGFGIAFDLAQKLGGNVKLEKNQYEETIFEVWVGDTLARIVYPTQDNE